MADSKVCCDKCGVHYCQESANDEAGPSSAANSSPIDPGTPVECEICAEIVKGGVSNVCGHIFCAKCWENYIAVKIHDGDLNSIRCPAHDCSKLVPIDVIERVITSPHMVRKFLTFDIKVRLGFPFLEFFWGIFFLRISFLGISFFRSFLGNFFYLVFFQGISLFGLLLRGFFFLRVSFLGFSFLGVSHPFDLFLYF